MARIRSIKPEFFRHVELYEAEKATGLPLRVAYAGLWTVADREGRFRWRPRVLVLDVLPFDEVDFAAVLDALARAGLVDEFQLFVAPKFLGSSARPLLDWPLARLKLRPYWTGYPS